MPRPDGGLRTELSRVVGQYLKFSGKRYRKRVDLQALCRALWRVRPFHLRLRRIRLVWRGWSSRPMARLSLDKSVCQFGPSLVSVVKMARASQLDRIPSLDRAAIAGACLLAYGIAWLVTGRTR
jgi:hypothetical protein